VKLLQHRLSASELLLLDDVFNEKEGARRKLFCAAITGRMAHPDASHDAVYVVRKAIDVLCIATGYEKPKPYELPEDNDD